MVDTTSMDTISMEYDLDGCDQKLVGLSPTWGSACRQKTHPHRPQKHAAGGELQPQQRTGPRVHSACLRQCFQRSF
jgi:hypothetical protein